MIFASWFFMALYVKIQKNRLMNILKILEEIVVEKYFKEIFGYFGGYYPVNIFLEFISWRLFCVVCIWKSLARVSFF